jgi:hypothetical protein
VVEFALRQYAYAASVRRLHANPDDVVRTAHAEKPEMPAVVLNDEKAR